jgi:hypothetical protein
MAESTVAAVQAALNKKQVELYEMQVEEERGFQNSKAFEYLRLFS